MFLADLAADLPRPQIKLLSAQRQDVELETWIAKGLPQLCIRNGLERANRQLAARLIPAGRG
jgi:hypothetical protein